MKTDIASPFAPVNTMQSEPLSPFTTLGIVADLCIHHGDYCQLSIDELITRVLPALKHGQAQIVFDPDNRTRGFASWILAKNARHKRLMQNPSVTTAPSESATPTKRQYLWFFDWISGKLLMLGDHMAPWGHASASSATCVPMCSRMTKLSA